MGARYKHVCRMHLYVYKLYLYANGTRTCTQFDRINLVVVHRHPFFFTISLSLSSSLSFILITQLANAVLHYKRCWSKKKKKIRWFVCAWLFLFILLFLPLQFDKFRFYFVSALFAFAPIRERDMCVHRIFSLNSIGVIYSIHNFQMLYVWIIYGMCVCALSIQRWKQPGQPWIPASQYSVWERVHIYLDECIIWKSWEIGIHVWNFQMEDKGEGGKEGVVSEAANKMRQKGKVVSFVSICFRPIYWVKEVSENIFGRFCFFFVFRSLLIRRLWWVVWLHF